MASAGEASGGVGGGARGASEALADDLAIRALVARYVDAVMFRDDVRWQETWAEDGVWNLMGHEVRGRSAIVSTWRAAMAGFPFVFQVAHSGVVELEGDEASGRWTLSELVETADGTRMLTLGLYHDRYRRLPEGWRFASRRLEVRYQGPPDGSGKVFTDATASAAV